MFFSNFIQIKKKYSSRFPVQLYGWSFSGSRSHVLAIISTVLTKQINEKEVGLGLLKMTFGKSRFWRLYAATVNVKKMKPGSLFEPARQGRTLIRCWSYLDSLIWGARKEQVSSGVDTQAPHRTLVADKRPLTLEDLLGVVCYTQAQTKGVTGLLIFTKY